MVFENLRSWLNVIEKNANVDSRSIKSSHQVAPDRGIDGNEKIKGRKEHIVVDTLGLQIGVVVHKAMVQLAF